MAREFIHASVATDLSQTEWEAVNAHVLESQATGDMIFALSETQLSGLSIGSAGYVLVVEGGIPKWTNVFNEAGADVDYRFEGDTNPNLLFLDASTDRVGIGLATPSALLDVAGNVAITNSGTLTVAGLVTASAGLGVTGNITVTGTVDGVDIATRDHARYTDAEAILAVHARYADAEAIAAIEAEATVVLAGSLDPASFVAGNGFIDEDSMATDSAVKAPSQQSVKAYVDAEVSGAGAAQATQAALEAETNEDTYAPPDLIKHSPGVAKGWCKFDGTDGGPITNEAAYNCDATTDAGTGDYQVNWTTNFSSANYAPFAASGATTEGLDDPQGVGTFNFATRNASHAKADDPDCMAVAFGDQ